MSSSLDRLARGVLWMALLLLLLAFGGVQPRWYLPIYAVLYALALWAVLTDTRGWGWIETGMVALLAIPWLQILLGASVDRAATGTWFLHWAAAAAVFLAARRWCQLETLARGLAALGGVLALEAVAQLFLTPTQVLGAFAVTTSVPMGTFVNRDDFAGCMVLLLPFALFLAVRRPPASGRRRAWLGLWWALAAAAMIGAVLISASRGGAIVMALELVAFAAWQFRRAGKTPGLVAAGVAVIMALGAYAAGFHALLARFQDQDLATNERVSFIASGLAMGAARPLLGWGVGSWEYVYPAYARLDDGHRLTAAHSDWTQLFAEAGALGLAAALMLGAGLTRELRAAWRRAPELAPAAAFALAGLSLHASIEFVLHIPALLLLFAFVAGAGAPAAAPPPRPRLAEPLVRSAYA